MPGPGAGPVRLLCFEETAAALRPRPRPRPGRHHWHTEPRTEPEAVRASEVTEEATIATSQNGFKANDRSVISTRAVPGTNVRLAVRNGAPGELLLEVAARFHREVESIEGAVTDDWGYAERNIRGSSTTLSNHASGTAIDLNAPRHPLGKAGTFSATQAAAIRRIVGSTGGVVRWGGDYTSRKDEMHFEINDGRTEQQCADALSRLRGGGPAPAPASGGDALVRAAQAKLKSAYKAYAGNLVVDGIPGPKTTAAIREFQARSHLPTSGVIDAATRAALHI